MTGLDLLSLVVLAMTTTAAFENYAITSAVNLERLLSLENDIFAVMDLSLQAVAKEDEKRTSELDVVKDIVKKVKEIHENIGNDTKRYLRHPVNVFHLVKRLGQDWSGAFERNKDNKLFKKALRTKVENLKEKLPTEKDLSEVAYGLVRLQYLYEWDMDDVADGTINETTSLEKFSPDDVFFIGNVAYEQENYDSATSWLRKATEMCLRKSGEKETSGSVNATNTLSLLASSYYQLRRMKDAVNAIDELLKADPYNVRARKNREFFVEKLNTDKSKQPELKKLQKQEKRYEELCNTSAKPSPTKQSKLHCYYHPTDRRMAYVKAEVLNRKPKIILFHGLTSSSIVEALQSLGLGHIEKKLSENPKEPVIGAGIKDGTSWKWHGLLTKNLLSLKHLLYPPFVPTVCEVSNIGLQGFFQAMTAVQASDGDAAVTRMKKDGLPFLVLSVSSSPGTQKPTTFGGKIGTFMVFLDDDVKGEIVFPLNGVKVTPKKGSALFWYAEKAYPAICPALFGFHWIATQGFYEQQANYCRPTEKM